MKIQSFIIASLSLIGTVQAASNLSNAYGNFVKIQVNQSQIPDPKQNIVHYIRIFDQFQDEYLQNNAVVLTYDQNDQLITSTQYTADTSKFIILNISASAGKGMFFTVDQITTCLKNPNDPYFYPWIQKCMGNEGINVSDNDYRVLTHRNPANDTQFYAIAKKPPVNKYLEIRDYGGSYMRYKGIVFDYCRFVIGNWNNNITNDGPFQLTDTGANFPDGRSFYLNYTSPVPPSSNPLNANLNIIDGAVKGKLPTGFTFNHNDFLFIDTDDNCWFTCEDVLYLLQNNFYFSGLGSNNYTTKLTLVINADHWNS